MKSPTSDDLYSLRERMLATHSHEQHSGGSTLIFKKIVGLSRWLLCAVVIMAPWIYGGTREWTIQWLNVSLISLTLIWFIASIFTRRKLNLHPLCLWLCIALLIAGWWMALNAKFIYDAEYNMFLDLKAWWPWAPGSVDRPASISLMVRTSALVGALLMSMDMSPQRKWRMRLWTSFTIAGITIALWGLIQKMAGAPMIFWETGRHGYFFFATYLYHGNAGAFINLVLPLVAGLTSYVFIKRRHAMMALLMPGSVVCVAAAFSHASKAAMVISILLLLAIAIWQARILWGAGQGMSQKISQMMSASVTGIAVIIIIVAAGWHFAAQRWDFFDVSKDARLFAYGISKKMIWEAGPAGFGPGTFDIMFNRYALVENPRLPVSYRYAHQDYMQTLIEWGWVGGLMIGIIFLGALGLAFWRCLFQGPRMRTTERLLLYSCGLSLFGIALHASVDFPLQIYSLQLYAVILTGMIWTSSSWLIMTAKGSSSMVKKVSHPRQNVIQPSVVPPPPRESILTKARKQQQHEKAIANKASHPEAPSPSQVSHPSSETDEPATAANSNSPVRKTATKKTTRKTIPRASK